MLLLRLVVGHILSDHLRTITAPLPGERAAGGVIPSQHFFLALGAICAVPFACWKVIVGDSIHCPTMRADAVWPGSVSPGCHLGHRCGLRRATEATWPPQFGPSSAYRAARCLSQRCPSGNPTTSYAAPWMRSSSHDLVHTCLNGDVAGIVVSARGHPKSAGGAWGAANAFTASSAHGSVLELQHRLRKPTLASSCHGSVTEQCPMNTAVDRSEVVPAHTQLRFVTQARRL